jgi:DNA-binding transcriptional regulator YhcF (GntR family)
MYTHQLALVGIAIALLESIGMNQLGGNMRQQDYDRRPSLVLSASTRSLIQLDKASGMPLYLQICRSLREAILSGQLSQGTRLPTERALAAELGVNRTTVMNAYNQLASEGLIEGHVGRGTIVRHNQYNHVNDDYDAEIPSWIYGLPAGERVLLGPDPFRLYTRYRAHSAFSPESRR